MGNDFSFTATTNRCLRRNFTSSGLRSTVIDLGDGTVMHCWIPKESRPAQPDVILLHGLGSSSAWQWASTVKSLSPDFNLYVPALVFFGESYSTRPDRSVAFQAECVMRVMEANSEVPGKKFSVVGLSYGGFVAYEMAARYKERVERVVICCAGVCLVEEDIKNGLFPVKSVEDAADLLLPQEAEKMRELFRYTFRTSTAAKMLPSCLLSDFIQEMYTKYVSERKELIREIANTNKKLSELPKITQPTLIVWGDQDKIFPLELGHRLKRHLEGNAELVVIKNTGHAFFHEKHKKFMKHLKPFLLENTNKLGLKTTWTFLMKMELKVFILINYYLYYIH